MYIAKDEEILPLLNPTFANFCQIVSPNEVPQGKILKQDIHLAYLLHSIVHIEFSAIDLALDSAYRFRNMPQEYYCDWIEVAKEEVNHYEKLNALLESLGFKYGDFKVHDTLFQALKICTNHLDRIALVPRGMEAVGLDVNPFLVTKIQKSKHKLQNEILEVLKLIFNEEISHVRKGSVWFNYLCDINNIEDKTNQYIEILEKYNFKLPKANTHINKEARIQAGFSAEEIEKLNLFSSN